MYALEKIKHELAREINKFLNTSVLSVVDFTLPPDKNFGDLSLGCFNLAKNLKAKPDEVAKSIEKFQHEFIMAVTAVGPYVNFTLSAKAFSLILENINKTKTKFGFNQSGNKARVMIEYSNANTHKEYHIGHLRNLVYGDAVNKILSANGYKTIPVSYINDFGIHTAKTLWWLYHENNEEAKSILATNPDKKGYFLGSQYTEASKELETNTEYKGEVAEVMKQIESRRGEIYKLWKKTRQWSLEQFAQIYKELNIKFSATFYENDFIDEGLRLVKVLENKGVLFKSDGAIIADFEKYKLGVLVILRSDGTALYPVADLALAIEKIKHYKLAQSLYVVDIRQSLYFDQVFKLLELLGYETKFEHLSYEFVKLPSGMMSSRTGNIIAYEDLKDLAMEKARSEVIKRHNDWDKKKINQVVSAIAFGALKFEMIKVSANKQIVFDIDKALRFDGNTSAYLQYTYARIKSIERKAPRKWQVAKSNSQELTEAKEKNLILNLGNFPSIVLMAGEKKDPAEIAKYLFDLAQLSNDYYHAVPVLKAESAIGAARLNLLSAVSLVIKQGLELLGIEVIEEM